MALAFTTAELMIVAGARELANGELAFVGLGIPQAAATLAQLTHAPGLVVLNEIGVADPHPVELGVGNADPRHWHGAASMGSVVDVMGKLLHRGLVDVGFLGALEVDALGNANATEVPREGGGVRRFGGGGGACDIASLARATILITRHERRKLVERVAHVTAPGARVRRVLTDKCVFAMDPGARRLVVRSIHPGVSAEELRAETGFALEIPDGVATTAAPSADELRLIRQSVDPERRYVATAERKG